LKKVDLTIERRGYGKIQWTGPIDVRNVNFDKIVIIERSEVTVLSDESLKERCDVLKTDAVVTLKMNFTYPNNAPKPTKSQIIQELKDFCDRTKDRKENSLIFVSWDGDENEFSFKMCL